MADQNTVKKSVPTRPGRNGGTLRIGNPGNKGGTGRPTDDTLDFLKSVASDPTVRDQFMRYAKAGSLKHFTTSLEYTVEKPAERKEITGDLTIKVEYDPDA